MSNEVIESHFYLRKLLWLVCFYGVLLLIYIMLFYINSSVSEVLFLAHNLLLIVQFPFFNHYSSLQEGNIIHWVLYWVLVWDFMPQFIYLPQRFLWRTKVFICVKYLSNSWHITHLRKLEANFLILAYVNLNN